MRRTNLDIGDAPCCHVCGSKDCSPYECLAAPGWDIEINEGREGGAEIFLDGPQHSFRVRQGEWISSGVLRRLGNGPWRAQLYLRQGEGEEYVELGQFASCQEAVERVGDCALRVASEFGPELEASMTALLARFVGESEG